MADAIKVERHRVDRYGWLRAAVLGANDGLISTASLVLGVVAAEATRSEILIAGVAGLMAGALSMAAGEYVSVSSQRDAERADIARERMELREFPRAELEELTNIYIHRGLDPDLARQVAIRLSENDPLGAHLRDELGITETSRARPLQAAVVSAISFALGAAPPVVLAAASGDRARFVVVAVGAMAGLALLGVAGAVAGGAPWLRGALRVTLGGGLAMAITALVGRWVGRVV